MSKFFTGTNNKCDHFRSGCNHKQNGSGNTCNEDICPLLLEAGLIDPEEVQRTAFIVDLYEETCDKADVGMNEVAALVKAMWAHGYEIKKKDDSSGPAT